MLPANLIEGLSRYDIGPKVRALRLRKKMGLAQLSKETGLSSAMISKIERERLFPTLPTLYRIAAVFGVGLGYFFSGELSHDTVSLLRKQDRTKRPNRTDGKPPSYFFEPFEFAVRDPRVKVYYAEYDRQPVSEIERHTHPGIEFVYVITGTLVIVFPDSDQVLQPGDAIAFEANRPHGYTRRGDLGCAAVVMTAE